MKKKLSLLVRLVLALAGLVYIAYSLDWVNRIEVKPGTVLSSGREVNRIVRMRVIAGNVDPAHQISDLTVEVPDDGNKPVMVPAAKLL